MQIGPPEFFDKCSSAIQKIRYLAILDIGKLCPMRLCSSGIDVRGDIVVVGSDLVPQIAASFARLQRCRNNN